MTEVRSRTSGTSPTSRDRGPRRPGDASRRGPARHARVRQGDDGRPSPGGHVELRSGRRQGLQGSLMLTVAEAAGALAEAGARRAGPTRRSRRRRARLRPGRLHGRVPRRRPRLSRAGRALRAPRRRLPERRLHPLEGAAARRARDRGGRGGRRAGHRVRRARDRPRRACARSRTTVVGKLTGGLDGLAKQRKVEVVRGDGRFTGPQRRVEASTDDRRSASSTASSPPARSAVRLPGLPRGPADDGLHRRARARRRARSGCSSSAAASSAWRWRRSTTRSARKVTVVEMLDQLHPRRRPGPRQAAAQADREALRGDPPRHEGRRRSRRATTACA